MIKEIDIKEYFVEELQIPLHLTLEVTRRCNYQCKFCYIADNRAEEMTADELFSVIDQALAIGISSFLLTGGEVLLHQDFLEIYKYLKIRGSYVTVFTNGSLINSNPEILKIFKLFPPDILEITMYAFSDEVHKKVTGVGILNFFKGLEMLLENNIKPVLKTTVTKLNISEINSIYSYTKTNKIEWRFDPFIVLRADSNNALNSEIESLRLSPEEIFAIEKNFAHERREYLREHCDLFYNPSFEKKPINDLFYCEAGISSAFVTSDFKFTPCCLIRDEKLTYDLRNGSLVEAFYSFIPKLRTIKTTNYTPCQTCSLINLCRYGGCPARLIKGELREIQYFCSITEKRKDLLFE